MYWYMSFAGTEPTYRTTGLPTTRSEFSARAENPGLPSQTSYRSACIIQMLVSIQLYKLDILFIENFTEKAEQLHGDNLDPPPPPLSAEAGASDMKKGICCRTRKHSVAFS